MRGREGVASFDLEDKKMNLLALAGMVAAATGGWEPYENPLKDGRRQTTTSEFRRKRRTRNRTAKRSRAINRRRGN